MNVRLSFELCLWTGLSSSVNKNIARLDSTERRLRAFHSSDIDYQNFFHLCSDVHFLSLYMLQHTGLLLTFHSSVIQSVYSPIASIMLFFYIVACSSNLNEYRWRRVFSLDWIFVQNAAKTVSIEENKEIEANQQKINWLRYYDDLVFSFYISVKCFLEILIPCLSLY